MAITSSKSFNLPWHQYDTYWIAVFAKAGSFTSDASKALQKAGMQVAAPDAMTMKTQKMWKLGWENVQACLKQSDLLEAVEIIIAPGDANPLQQAPVERKKPLAVQQLADSLWLGDALLEQRIRCYLQPVLSGRDKIFGYESFARVQMTDGTLIGGAAIVAASKVLNMEYMIDRHLQVQAIKTFVSSDFNGFLFVNFFPGFIHRPAVYLEGLSDTVKAHGIVAKHIVLDFTRSETHHNMSHLKSVCEYGRLQGYSIALDDVESVDNARKLLTEIRPDFVKIGMQLVSHSHEASARQTILKIAELVHAAGGTVIAEGVETEAMYEQVKSLGVDLFQGYYFSPPVPVETVLKRGAGAA